MSALQAKKIGEPILAMSDVTPSDSVEITNSSGLYPNALYVGVGGTVVITDVDGTDHTLKNMVSGAWHRMSYRKVKSTSTTATDMVAGWA